MKRFFLFFTILLVSICTWAGNVITYTATSKLKETTDTYSTGLHTYAFNRPISSHTFSNGTGTITFSSEVTRIGYNAFMGCSKLTSITIPNSVTSIEYRAFLNCSGLTSVTIPNSVTSIGDGAFDGCSKLTSVTIPNSVTSIDDFTFYDCTSLTSVTIPNSVTSIGNSAFRNCYGLTSITIPNSVTSIGEKAFYNCSGLTSVTIPNSVTSIGIWAFFFCSGLTSITIPNSVTSIGESAFLNCSGLTSVTIECETPPSFGSDCFEGTAISKIYVPCGTLTAYKASSSTYAEYFSYPDGEYHLTLNWNKTLGRVDIISIPYTCNNEVTFSATPNSGYHFTQWSDGNTDNPRTIILTSDTTFTAEFAVDSFTISVSAENGSVTGAGTYESGTEVTLTATANEGFHFVRWSDGNTDNPRGITVTKDTTYTAEFVENERFTISVSAENGSVTGAGTYESSTEVTLTATANYGYYFTQWSDGNTTNPRTIVVTEDATYTAEFAKNPTISGYIVDYQNNIGTFSFTGNVEQSYVYYDSNCYRSTAIKMSKNFLSNGTDYNYVKVTPLEGGFQAGDTIMISGCFNNADDTKDATVTFRYYLSDMEPFFTTDYFFNGRTYPIIPPLQKFVLTQSCNALYLGRLGNTATYIIELIVSRPADANTQTELEQVESVNKCDTPTKLLRNGQVLILRGDRLYDLRGQEVK